MVIEATLYTDAGEVRFTAQSVVFRRGTESATAGWRPRLQVLLGAEGKIAGSCGTRTPVRAR